MRYAVKQKLFSIGDKFTVKDEYGADVYVIKRQLLSVGKKLRIYDLDQTERCYIEQKLFKFLPEYSIFIGGELKACVKKKFALLKNDFNITGTAGEFSVSGNIWGHEFTIFKDGHEAARISKKYLSLADTYTVDIDVDQDQILILSLAIVIDMVLHDGNNR